MKTLKEFLETLDKNTWVVIFIGGCSMCNIAKEHLKNEKLCSNKIKKIYQYSNNYAIDLN